jgi:hypothetical protein
MTDLEQHITACGEWMLRNQVDHAWDANHGRIVWCYDSETGHTCLANNWLVGISAMGFLALHRHTGQERFLQAAIRAGRYVQSCQILDSHEARYYGAIRECTPQTDQFCPRDATSAAWSFIWLFKATGEEEFRHRAILFGNWHLRYGMNDGWPIWHIEMAPDKPNSYWAGAFQAGTGLFYRDLFAISDDPRYIQDGLKPIARRYITDFLTPDGQIIGVRDGLSGDRIDGHEYGMHFYNDDFSAAMLQAASDLLADDRYRQAARRYVSWLAGQQQQDGSFGPAYPSAVPVSLMYFHDLGTHYSDPQLLEARDRALEKLLSMQFRDTRNPQLEGGFNGTHESGWSAPQPKSTTVNLRTTAYALMALLKLQGTDSDIWLGREGTPYTDPNTSRHRAQFMVDCDAPKPPAAKVEAPS